MKHQIDIQKKGTSETVSYDAGPKKKLYKLQELLQKTKSKKWLQSLTPGAVRPALKLQATWRIYEVTRE